MRRLSTRELADALAVSESSLKRWVDAGKIRASRTEGGHRRIALSEAMRFIRETQTRVARPELLDLPEMVASRARGEERLLGFLRDGDAISARGWLTERYLSGATIAELSDGPIREAMHALGELWHHEEGGVFVEHRGTDVCLQAIAQLRSMMPSAPENAPVALGGGPAGDPYLIPAQLAAMVVTEVGMRAINLGPDTPVATFEHAIEECRPRLVWLSISTALAPARSRAYARWLEAVPAGVAIAIGGQQASTLTGVPPRAQRITTMRELADIATALIRKR